MTIFSKALLDSLLFHDESSDTEEDEGQDEKIVLISDGWKEKTVDAIQIMQLPRMMEHSMCMQNSTLTQTLGQLNNIFHQF